MRALIIVDVQNDFMPGGSLAVPHSDTIVPRINRLQKQFPVIVATQDWHPANHKSFASTHAGKKPFEKVQLQGIEQILWPDHCVQGTEGAQFHSQLVTQSIAAIFRKGMDPEFDSYSGFYDVCHRNSTGLSGYLYDKGVSELYFCGLCADICVYFSIKDALEEGFTHCWLIEDAVCPLNDESFQKIKEELINKGVKIVNSGNIF